MYGPPVFAPLLFAAADFSGMLASLMRRDAMKRGQAQVTIPASSTLNQQKFWDAETREVILDRVHDVPEIQFFTPDQARLMEAVCARILPTG